MIRQAGIRTKRLCNGAYQFYYKHLRPLIIKVEDNAWQAFLPSGAFANARTKAQCVILACLEIDKTPTCKEDEITNKNVTWWQGFSEFKWLREATTIK